MKTHTNNKITDVLRFDGDFIHITEADIQLGNDFL